VAGLAGSVLVGLVAFIQRHHAEAVRRESARDGALVVERALHSLISGAPPFLSGASQRSTISGDGQKIIIISTGPSILNLSRETSFQLRREGGTFDGNMVLSWIDDTGTTQRATLAHGVSELMISYLPPDNTSIKGRHYAGALWRTQWRPEDGPLSALRFVFRLEPSSIRKEIVIPFWADLPTACLRNPQQDGCDLEGSRG
jgi:hypothetical protein